VFDGPGVGAPLFKRKGAPTKVNFIQEESVIRVQRKKKKRCISANQEEGFFLFVLMEEVSKDISFFIF
jgi:hypothetical protein